jgi:predicted Zn-dependent peptidase
MFTLSDFGVTRTVATLSNGIRLVTFERKGAPLAIDAMIYAGARFDPSGKEGMAHFAEHIIAAETEKFPTQDRFSAFIERLGGHKNAHTGRDRMSLEVQMGDPSDISAAVEVISEMALHPLFRSETVESERLTIYKEIGMDHSKPDRYLLTVWNSLVYQDSLVGRPILGTQETLSSVSGRDIKTHYQNFLNAGRMAIVAAGDIAIDRLQEELEKKLTLPSAPRFKDERKPTEKRERFIAVKRYEGIEQVYFNFGFRSCSMFEDDDILLDAIGAIVAGGFNSVLYKKLRIEKGLVYSVGAGNTGSNDRGSWVVISSTDKKNLNEVLKIVTNELMKLRDGEITEDQLQFVKDRMLKSIRMRTQTAASWVNNHEMFELFRPDMNFTIDQGLNRIADIKLEEIKAAAKKYFKPNSWYFAACGDIEESDIKISY